MANKDNVRIAPASGKLGILLVGQGAVTTTFIAGVEAVKRGLAQPIGPLTQSMIARMLGVSHVSVGKQLPLPGGLVERVPGGWRAVDRRDMRAGLGQLRGLAAGRSAEIGNRLASDVAEQPRRQRGGGVLHPPLPFAEAGQHGHRAMQNRAH